MKQIKKQFKKTASAVLIAFSIKGGLSIAPEAIKSNLFFTNSRSTNAAFGRTITSFNRSRSDPNQLQSKVPSEK